MSRKHELNTQRENVGSYKKTTEITWSTQRELCLTARTETIRVRASKKCCCPLLQSDDATVELWLAAEMISIYRKSHITHELTRLHDTQHLSQSVHRQTCFNKIFHFMLSLPVLHVRILKLTGLHRCCVHLHTICQQQTSHQQNLIKTAVILL